MKNNIFKTKICTLLFITIVGLVLSNCKAKKKSNKLAFMGLIAVSSQSNDSSVENTSQLCLDGIDNNGDGNVDCEDISCQYFTFCSTSSASNYEYTSS